MKTESTPALLAAVPKGLIERIIAAERRIEEGHCPRRIPADPTDVDLVLAEVRHFFEGRSAPFWVPAPAAEPSQSQPTVADLQGLRDALLAPREVHRDACGMLDHPSFPVFDEDVNMRLFLKAFGLEASFALMEDDVDLDAMEAYDGNSTAWTPTPPVGEGWRLTLIYDTEEGPCALFVRALTIATSRRRRAWQDAAGRSEWDAAQAICDHRDVDEALRNLAGDPTGDNATCVVRSVLRQVSSATAGVTRERTPRSYAKEHAGYLADAAETLIAAVCADNQAQLDHSEHDSQESARAADEAREDAGEHMTSLRAAHRRIAALKEIR